MSLAVDCRDVSLKIGARTVLNQVDWRLAAGEVAGLVGKSGAGKTSLLRLLAGLDRCTSGRVLWADSGAALPPANVAMVFQNLGLWPHLTVSEHLHCVLTGIASRERTRRAEQLLEEVQLPKAAWRSYPAELSGGEAQRLALARSLAPAPALLLLDEPLAQLDDALRGCLLELLASIARERGVTVVYVSHAWTEVASLCRSAAVLDAGRLLQQGPVTDLHWRPGNSAVARATGPVIEIPLSLLATGAISRQRETGPWPEIPLTEGEAIFVRPQQLRLGAPAGPNAWMIERSVPEGAGWRLDLHASAQRMSLIAGSARDPGSLVSINLLVCRG